MFHASGTIYPLLVGHNFFHSDTIHPWYTRAQQKQKPFYKLAIFKMSFLLNLIFPFIVCEFWVHFGPLFWQSLKIKPYKCTCFLVVKEPFLFVYSEIFLLHCHQILADCSALILIIITLYVVLRSN